MSTEQQPQTRGEPPVSAFQIAPFFRRTLAFVRFTLIEYARSGRILVEVLAIAAAWAIFFRRVSETLAAEYFFAAAGLFCALLSCYTTTAILGLGDRPQGYIVLARRLSRSGYLLGLYLAALAVSWGGYGVLSLLTALLNPVAGLDLRGWLLGSVPLLLNVALCTALLTLLAPIVLSIGWRLLTLAFITLAFSGSLIGGQTMGELALPLKTAIDVVRTICSTPLLPAFAGFALAVDRDYSGYAAVVPISQLTLTLSLLSLAIYAFGQREIIFSGRS